jgi:hypothetical protein
MNMTINELVKAGLIDVIAYTPVDGGVTASGLAPGRVVTLALEAESEIDFIEKVRNYTP